MLKDHKDSFIKNDAEDPLLMEVRRESILEDALAVISVSQEDLNSQLRIAFSGEEGVDLGGLGREFWSLFLYKITNSIYVTGK